MQALALNNSLVVAALCLMLLQERCLVGAYDLRSLDLTAAALRDSQEDKVVLVDLPAGGPKKPWGLPRGMGDSRGLIGSGNAGAPHPEAWRTNGVSSAGVGTCHPKAHVRSS